MYIIDNDGLANSDKRFQTKLRNNRNGWMHDEISGWVNTTGEEKAGVLEARWLKFDDTATQGTEWIDEKGIERKERKAGNISMDLVISNEYITLLPEYYLRPSSPHFVSENDFLRELKNIEHTMKTTLKISAETELIKKDISLKNQCFQATNIPISQIIGYVSGNSGLTEEKIYTSLQRQGVRYEVLSSATEDRTKMGKVPVFEINNKKIKVFEGREGLLVTRNGKAGTTKYLEPGRYTINDHAYILYVKDNCPYQINLKWLAIQYRPQFLEYVSSSDNGTWNMTGFFKAVKIDIPSIKEQEMLVNLWSIAEKHMERINNIQLSFDTLMSKEIALT
jgi:hypothetical protein